MSNEIQESKCKTTLLEVVFYFCIYFWDHCSAVQFIEMVVMNMYPPHTHLTALVRDAPGMEILRVFEKEVGKGVNNVEME